MMLYLSFPVTMFWISNQAEYFEEYIVKRKREIFPPDEVTQRKELEDFKERMRVRKEQRILKHFSVDSENWTWYFRERHDLSASLIKDCQAVIIDFVWIKTTLHGKYLQCSHLPNVWNFLIFIVPNMPDVSIHKHFSLRLPSWYNYLFIWVAVVITQMSKLSLTSFIYNRFIL